MRHKYLKNVTTLNLNKDICTNCGMCINVCPQEVFEFNNSRLVIIDKDRCMECGACEKNCPVNALSVRSGVGCAAAMIKGALTGTEPSCGCGSGCGDMGKGSGCCG